MHNLVGYFKLNKNEVEKEKIKKLRVELERFYVLSALQNKGIGALILLKVLNITNHYGGNFLWLGIWQKNKMLLGFMNFKDSKSLIHTLILLAKTGKLIGL